MAQATYAGYSDDDLVATIGQLHAAESATRRELCRVIAEYERREAYYTDGARTMADWLVARFGMTHRSAVELAKVAAELESLPALAGTLAEGRLGWDQAAAAASLATPETDEQVAHDAPGMTAAELRARARRSAHREGDAETNHRRRSLRLWWERDRQNLHLSGQVPALASAVIETALRRIAEAFPPDPANGLYESIDARMADALEALASTALATDADGDRACVVIHIEAEDLFIGGPGELEDGGMVSASELLAASCDAAVAFVAGARGHTGRDRAQGSHRAPLALPPAQAARPGLPVPGLWAHPVGPCASHHPLGERRGHRPREPGAAV